LGGDGSKRQFFPKPFVWGTIGKHDCNPHREDPRSEDTMKGKDLFWLVLFGVFIWCAVSAVKPYWERYWLGRTVETAAIYGTKHTIEKTRKFLTKRMNEEGWDFDGGDFTIEKEKDKTVTISITYGDEIRIFGHTVKELEFTVERTSEEVEEMF
jgi:hypothetical protein